MDKRHSVEIKVTEGAKRSKTKGNVRLEDTVNDEGGEGGGISQR